MPTPLDSESKHIIEDTLLRFIEESYDPNVRRQRLNNPPLDYLQHWSRLAELGILGLPFAEEKGGISGCAIDTADTVRVLAKGIVLEPYIESAVIAGSVLASGSDPLLTEAEIAALIGGETLTILVGARSGVPDILFSEKASVGYKLTGQVHVVPYAAEADAWLVATRDVANGEARIFRVPRGQPGISVQQYRLMDGRSASDAIFNDVLLPKSALWLDGDAASSSIDRAGLQAVSAYCASAVGAMDQLMKLTGDYLKTRVQFGVVIGSFQALQHRYATMHMAFLQARAIARKLAISLDSASSEEQERLSLAAASVVERAGTLIGHESIQMHGGMGTTDELIVSHYNAHLVVLAKQINSWINQDTYLADLGN